MRMVLRPTSSVPSIDYMAVFVSGAGLATLSYGFIMATSCCRRRMSASIFLFVIGRIISAD